MLPFDVSNAELPLRPIDIITADEALPEQLELHAKRVARFGPDGEPSLFAEIVTILSLGKALCRSLANCSAHQRLTSHPVISKSTLPSSLPSS